MFILFSSLTKVDGGVKLAHLGRVSPTTVNSNRRFSPHFNLELA